MATTARATPYGAAAYRALREVVGEAKADDPLAPVMVIVPGERVGVAVRRSLAHGVVKGRPGVAALQVVTLRRFAEVTSGAALAGSGRRPLTGPLLIGAIRQVLTEAPGVFGPVADHIGTARSLARACRELRPLPDAVVDLLASEGGVVADTVRVFRELQRSLASHAFDEVDLMRAATGEVRQRGVSGAVVLFLPQDLDPTEAALLTSLAAVTDLRVIVGLTGDARADRLPVALCETLGCAVLGTPEPMIADVVVHASDPDDEVRGVVRRVVTALADRPGYRIAVFYGTADPYARLLHEHLARAGVAVFGRGVRPTAETRFGRGFLRLLELGDHGFRRDEVMAFIADAPVRHRGRAVPSSAWERISRAAGVVQGTDWDRVRQYADHRRAWIDDHPEVDDVKRQSADRDAVRADDLYAFVAALGERLARIANADTWRDLSDEVTALWSSILMPEDPDSLPPAEKRAVDRISAVLASLGGLDGVVGRPRMPLLRQLVELELGDDLDRVGRIGEGVHVGPLPESIGEDVDVVFVVGAAEGLLPARPSDDPLLPDRVRALTCGVLPTQAERMARQHRHVLAALAAAPAGQRVLTFPRGDLRVGGTRVPSRWLVPTLRALSDQPKLAATRWESASGLAELPSYAGAIERERAPATAQEWRQRAAVEDSTAALGDPVVDRAVQVRAARASSAFTEFDGNLAGEHLPDPTARDMVAATSLEHWVQCPYGYFVRHLLGVTPVEQPEQVVRISALDRGTIVHDILEQVIRHATDEGWLPHAGQPWPPQVHAVLDSAADERFAHAEADGVTGFALLWALDREGIRADVHAWVEQDNHRRREFGGLAPIAAEWAFDAVEIPLDGTRSLRVRGKIDRIDRAADGRLVVLDYKTGKADSYRGLEEDPCQRGQRLQLPVYAVAAQAAFGVNGAPVRSEYWFTSRRAGFARIGYSVDEAILTQMRHALSTIVDGIRHGVFLARPKGNGNVLYDCPACDPDGLGEHDVAAAWDAKAHTEQLTPLLALLNGEGPA